MKKNLNRELRKKRVRAKISGTAEVPRMSVATSLSHIRVQIIDDTKGLTLCSADDLKIKDKKTKTEKAAMVGETITKLAKEKKINKIVFDRSFKLYHGRVKALAEAARKAGLEF
jgi:large subunit ribosomal protein L18